MAVDVNWVFVCFRARLRFVPVRCCGRWSVMVDFVVVEGVHNRIELRGSINYVAVDPAHGYIYDDSPFANHG